MQAGWCEQRKQYRTMATALKFKRFSGIAIRRLTTVNGAELGRGGYTP
jgi:hypothetical protein